MRRGEVWWTFIDERCPVVLLAGDASEVRAMRIVAPATTDEKRGFVVLTAEQATEPQTMRELIAAAGTDVRAVGVEVEIGGEEGLPYTGVVRVALPREGHVFCTWLVTLAPDDLIERAGALRAAKLERLGNALRMAGVE